MPVPAVITDLAVAVASNSPAGTEAVTTSTGPDEYFRAHAAILRRLQAKGANVASAATVDLGAINDGSYVNITGTTTITSFGTIAAGVERTLLFADALTLTHDAAKIILPGAANIVTVAEDVAVFVSEGAGLWRCKSYQRKAVPPSVPLDASVVTAKIANGAVTTVKVADDAVTYAKIQNVTATDRLLGRATAGAGDVEEIVCTPFSRTLLDDVDATAAQTTLGITAFAKTLLDDVDATAAQTTLGINATLRYLLDQPVRRWTSRTTPADNAWRGIAWSPERGLFVAVAFSGVGNRVMTSPDGITWTSRTSAADNDWFAVAWSPALALFVAVANSGVGNRVMTSPDGITWTSRTTPDNAWCAVAWSPERGLFAAVAENGTGNRVMTSA